MPTILQDHPAGPSLLALRDIYETSFPVEEQRPWTLIASPRDSAFSLLGIYPEDNSNPIGLVTLWHLEHCLYVEHLALSPECRRRGYGSDVMRQLLSLAETNRIPLILEAEPSQYGELAVRRLRFYYDLGIVPLPYPYRQPPYGDGLPWVDLLLLSNQNLKPFVFATIVQEIYERVYQEDSMIEALPQG